MILQELSAYYERKRTADPDAMPEEGFERKPIPFVIVLSEAGEFVDLWDTREGSDRGRTFTVPQFCGRSNNIKANLLWDHGGYVLGAVPGDKSPERTALQHQAFLEAIERIFGQAPADAGVAAVVRFLRAGDFEGLFRHPLWKNEEASATTNFSFKLASDPCLVVGREPVRKVWRAAAKGSDAPVAQCLVTGVVAPVARLHPLIKGVRGAQASGASIVAFNLDAFRTHRREQGANAPVSERATFAYTTALNRLLARDSKLKAQVGDTTVVFWAKADNPVEDLAGALFGDDQDLLDDPDAGVEKLRAIYSAPWKGAPPLKDDESRFFVLGLAPNASRISMRFWRPTTVSAFARAVLQHFEDIQVDRPPWASRHPSIRNLLRSTAVLGKDKNIAPNLGGAVLNAIVTGGRYPRTLLPAAVQRTRAEHEVTADRAAVLRGCLVRDARHSTPAEPEVAVSLDESNHNVGYLLGRLFAALERAQERGNPGIQRGIRERYYASASATPTAVFPALMRLKNHHLAKLENKGERVNLEHLLGSIIDGIDDFPPILSLTDQGRFALGYYHQRQAFFAKSDTEEKSDD